MNILKKSGYNLRRVRGPVALLLMVALAVARPAAAQTVRVEAESYVNDGGGVGPSRTGGGTGVGVIPSSVVSTVDGKAVSGSYVDQFRASTQSIQEYLEYVVNAPQDGQYTIVARGATPNATATLRFWNMSYGPIIDETVSGATSGAWDPARMNTFTLANVFPMKAGPNRIRVYAGGGNNGSGGINADYYEFTYASPLSSNATGLNYGLVSGQVTTDQGPVPPMVQVFADVQDVAGTGGIFKGGVGTGTPGQPGPNFRAIAGVTGAEAPGTYHMLLPQGARTLVASAPNYDDPTNPAAQKAVTVSAADLTGQDLALTYNGKTEAEWWDNAFTSPTPIGPGFGTYFRWDKNNAAVSGDAVIGNWDSPNVWMEYSVWVPANGVYNLTLHVGTGASSINILQITTSDGANFETRIQPTTATNDYQDRIITPSLALKQGYNTIRIRMTGSEGENLDWIQVATASGSYGTVSGTITNTDKGQPAAGVTVSILDASASPSTQVATATTDASGHYSVILPPGSYYTSVNAFGYGVTPSDTYTINGGDTATGNASIALNGTIAIGPDQVTGTFSGGANTPSFITNRGSAGQSSLGRVAGNVFQSDAIDYTFDVPQAGLYDLSIEYSADSKNTDGTAVNELLQIDVHVKGSNQHYATPDITFQSTTAFTIYSHMTVSGVPFQQGTNVMRFFLPMNLHNATVPATAAGGGHNFSAIVLTRSGDLPAYSTVSGTVSGSDTGVNVADAYVMAVPSGATVPAVPGPFWQTGYWSTTDANGAYTLSAPAGTYTVVAGRPDTYAITGASAPNVTVPSASPVNLSLTSRWSGGSLTVEDEYYEFKEPDYLNKPNTGIVYTILNNNPAAPGANASGGIKMSGMDADIGDFMEFLVDTPAAAAGLYQITSSYFNGGTGTSTGQLHFDANGTYSLDSQPTLSANNVPGTKVFAQPIKLVAGTNLVHVQLMGGTSELDAFKLSPFVVPSLGTVSFSPATVAPGGSTTISVTVTPGSNAVASVTADLTAIGGPASQALSNGGSGNTYTATINVPAGATGGAKSIPVTVTDAGGVTATATGTLTIGAGPVKGDVNGDGVFDAKDVAAALRIAGGLDPITPQALQAGDVAGSGADGRSPDNSLTVSDALRLQRALNGNDNL